MIENEEANKTDLQFMPQPKVSKAGVDLMATTQLTLTTVKTQDASNFIEKGSSIVSREINPYFKKSIDHESSYYLNQHSSALGNSFQIERVRYQNLSHLSSHLQTDSQNDSGTVVFKGMIVTKKHPKLSDPGKSDLLRQYEAHSVASLKNKKGYRTFSNGVGLMGDDREKNNMATTTTVSKTAYETQKSSISPRDSNPMLKTSAEFKCRYKELTWNEKPQGFIPIQVDIKPQVKVGKRKKPKLSKRLSSEVGYNPRPWENNGQQKELKSPQNFRMQQQSPDVMLQLPKIAKTELKQAPFKARHHIPSQKIQKKNIIAATSNSNENQNEQLNGMYSVTDANSQGPRSKLKFQDTASKTKNKSNSQSSEETFQTKAKLKRTPEITSQEQSLATTFEVSFGGKTGYSIFYDEHQVMKEREKEFDRLYGAREGKKLRAGQSVEVKHARTMEETRRFLHPTIRQVVKQHFRHQQVAKVSTANNSSRIQSMTENFRAAKHHSIYSQIEKDYRVIQPSPLPVHILKAQPGSEPIAIISNATKSQSYSIIGLERAVTGYEPLKVIEEYEVDSQKQMSIPVINDLHRRNLTTVPPVPNPDVTGFSNFKSLGGTFYNQKERQIITMDNNGGLHYEHRRPDFHHTMAVFKTAEKNNSKTMTKPISGDKQGSVENWDIFKDEVMRIVKKGILSNKPKPKKIIPIPVPEPEIDRLLHLNVRTVKELLLLFSPEEQDVFNEELITFSVCEEPTRYLINQIDKLLEDQNNPYSVHLAQMYKFLLQKRVEIAHSKQRLRQFKPESMLPHFERFMRKVYDGIVAEIRSEIRRQKIERQIKNGQDSLTAALDADKQMSLTRMKEMNFSCRKKSEAEKDQRILEYIKFLIGQTANNEFRLSREEFRQTHELNTKSLSLTFDQYASKEDNCMKKVANDILERVEMNIVIQENMMPIAALKYANDPKFTYFMSIKSQMSLALPLLAKVVNKQLSLHNYTLGTAHCIAFGETCKVNSNFMSKLVLNNNGLKDEDFATLLNGMQHLKALNVIDVTKNIVGEASVRLMSNFMSRNFPNHLQVLRIMHCKISQPATYTLLRLLTQTQKLRTLALVEAQFNAKTENVLVEFLEHNITLKELDLSWNNMSQQAYVDILKCVVENNNLLTLNLAHNTLIRDPNGFTKTEEAKAIKKEKMRKYTVMNLQDREIASQMRKQAGLNMGSSRKNSQQQSFSSLSQKREIEINLSNSGQSSRQNASAKKQNENRLDTRGLLKIRPLSAGSIKSYHKESQHSYQGKIDEQKSKRVLKANQRVSDSSQINQIITHLICQVTKMNRKLQHLDLSSTNLPSYIIVYICNRLRKSRSILSVHFTDNPGLQDPTIYQTIHSLMKCAEPEGTKIKINVRDTVDYALNSNMLERLQHSLANEKLAEGEQLIARDTIRIRQVMQQKRIEQKAIDFPKDPQSNKLILSRIIGFKEQMPGSGQWKLLQQNKDECWHCDQWIYSLVFWDAETIGRNAKKTVHHKVLNQMVKKIEAINPGSGLQSMNSMISLSLCDDTNTDLESLSDRSRGRVSPIKTNPSPRKSPHEHEESDDWQKDNAPVLFGSFTNWKGVKMMPVDDFVMILAKKYGRQNQEMNEDFQQILQIMRQKLNGMRRSQSKFISNNHLSSANLLIQPPSNDVREYSDLTEQQQKFYNQIVAARQKKIVNDWKGVLEQYLEYRKPFLIDGYQLNKPQYKGRCKNLYVLPAFIPAGKHTYLVKNNHMGEYTMHTTIADFRTEDPPVLIKELKHKVVERVFRKENSVFEPWKEDTELSLQNAVESDLGNCKLTTKLIKDEQDLTVVFDKIYENFAYLKLLFLQVACHSSYPFITWIDYQAFCAQLGLLDNNLKLSTIDICFATANSKPTKGQLKMGLNRAEFIEMLVRLAIVKYLTFNFDVFQATKTCKKPSEAFDKLLNEDIKPKWVLEPSWMEFRQRYLWTLDVNDVFAANLFGIQKIYTRQQTIHKTWLEFSEAQYLFCTNLNLVTDFNFRTCYGYSKMTVVNEHNDGAQHQRLALVEFLELIARVAVTYWENNMEHLQEVMLAKKIEFVLDQLFSLIGVKRNEVNIEVDTESCTDEDY